VVREGKEKVKGRGGGEKKREGKERTPSNLSRTNKRPASGQARREESRAEALGSASTGPGVFHHVRGKHHALLPGTGTLALP
jgi:hypothetical protein